MEDRLFCPRDAEEMVSFDICYGNDPQDGC